MNELNEDLIAFLRDRLRDDKAVSEGVRAPREGQAIYADDHIVEMDVARLRLDLDGKHRLVDMVEARYADSPSSDELDILDQILGNLVLPYATHPEFKENWRARR